MCRRRLWLSVGETGSIHHRCVEAVVVSALSVLTIFIPQPLLLEMEWNIWRFIDLGSFILWMTDSSLSDTNSKGNEKGEISCVSITCVCSVLWSFVTTRHVPLPVQIPIWDVNVGVWTETQSWVWPVGLQTATLIISVCGFGSNVSLEQQ